MERMHICFVGELGIVLGRTPFSSGQQILQEVLGMKKATSTDRAFFVTDEPQPHFLS
jgi:hypothetical protein